jgi:O-antigen/teichoic acid export membrane protein
MMEKIDEIAQTQGFERRPPDPIRSMRWLTLSNFGRISLQFLGIYVLARLLTPKDFGSMALVLVITNLAGLLRDMGTGATIVQRDKLSGEILNSVFFFNISVGVALCAVLLITSSFLAIAFGAPQIGPLIMLSSVVFPIVASAGVHQALLERNSRFLEIAAIEVVSYAAGLLVAIIFALKGYGATSLVIQAIVTTCMNTALLWSRSPWYPKTNTSWSALTAVLSHSGTITLFNFLSYISKNVDQAIAASQLGLISVGFYSQAQKLTSYPQQLTALTAQRALAPKFASLQNDRVVLRDLTARTLAFMLAVSGILVVIILGNSRNFIDVVLGHQWTEVSTLLYYLLPSAVLNSMTSVLGSYFIAIGARRNLLLSGAASATFLVLCASIGVKAGLIGVCAGILVHSILSFALTLVMIDARRFVASVAKYCSRPFLIVLTCGITAHIISTIDTGEIAAIGAPFISVAMSTSISGGLFLALTFLFDEWTFHKLAMLVGLRRFHIVA